MKKNCLLAAVLTVMVLSVSIAPVVYADENSGLDPVLVSDFCTHLHQWGGNNTTYPTDELCGQSPSGNLTAGVFCTHIHRFALNNTTHPAGTETVALFCNSVPSQTEVPIYIFCTHTHLNANSSTTFPIPTGGASICK